MKKTILYAAAITTAVTAATAVIVGCGAEQTNAAATSYNAATPNSNTATPYNNAAAPADTATPYVPVSTVKVVSAGAGASGNGVYPAGATVTISAGTLTNIHQFKEWTTESDSVTFADAESSTTTFIMPANGVTVTANFLYNGACDYVVIGGVTWMRKNLNVETLSGSWCYGNSSDSCKKYGRLYDWETAMTVCPTGWHLPTKEEWEALIMAVGGYNTAGKALKATSGWCFDGGGTDDFGFSALPGGILSRKIQPYQTPPDSKLDFSYGGGDGFWWTATEAGKTWKDDDRFGFSQRYYHMFIECYENHVNFGWGSLDWNDIGHSVRCVKDIR